MAEEKNNPGVESHGPKPARTDEDASLRVGATHGSQTAESERTGYAREIGEPGAGDAETNRAARTRNSGLTSAGKLHPSRRLELRARGYGIGGGYERPYRRDKSKPGDDKRELYGPLPHAGYYGTGTSERPFKIGQASFNEEMSWYEKQYGEETSGYTEAKKK